ncbi:CRISPR-associated helicase/endonuclease Cas3 [Streptomyces sp. CMB-StM0423]|nr:CRISPR-associated helicase/endonuclease Cas3 [Streptomyces sp. CMB-StM0423]
MIDTRLWGKADGLERPYPLVGHLVDTAMVAGGLWDSVLAAGRRELIAGALGVCGADARRVVMFWAGLHDVGKILSQFQELARRDQPAHCAFLGEAPYVLEPGLQQSAKIRHELATSRVVPQLLAELGYPVSGRPAGLLLMQVAQLLGGHHGRYPRAAEERDLRDPLAGLPELGCGGWEDQRREHVTALHEVLGRPVVPAVRALPVDLAVVVAGVVIISDWLASQEHAVAAQQAAAEADGGLASPEALAAHAERAERAASGLVEAAGLGCARFRSGGLRELFPQIAKPYELQASLERGLSGAVRGPGVLLVTAPPGEGKTEAALYAAALMGEVCSSSGVFFALPTQATANQMYGRVLDFTARNVRGPAKISLLHGAADLFAGYAEPAAGEDEVEPRVLSQNDADSRGAAEAASLVAGRWLRMRGRGILAPVTVGTVDQALMAVLPIKWNALRHLGLSGKTVIIDEAHAYDAYTHALLLRLLTWLGAMDVPVVLLSATLTGSTATGLIEAYLVGAGHPPGASSIPQPAYPGWLYADAAQGRTIGPSAVITSERARTLTIARREVAHSYDPTRADGRLALLLEELEPVVAEGGCAAVICTTVAEAQQTYQALREHYRALFGADYRGWDDRSADDAAGSGAAAGPHLRLLHARFPAHRRGQITAEMEQWFGPVGKEGVQRPRPPRGAVLVATQVIEQSLDLDFDLMITDLAPMALLLQRAGRIWRHAATPRPRWCQDPRLAVLIPADDEGRLSPPAAWGDVYAPSLLQRTVDLLEQHGSACVRVPGDVQTLVDGVYAEEFVSSNPENLMKWDIKRLGDEMARTHLAGMVMLPPPQQVGSLHELTTSEADEDLIATRLGLESVPLLPVFVDAAGRRWLDEACEVPLPPRGSRPDGRFTRAEVRALLGYVVPLAHGRWHQSAGEAHEPPPDWRQEPRLSRLVLAPHQVTEQSTAGAIFGDHVLTLTHTLGLTVRRLDE